MSLRGGEESFVAWRSAPKTGGVFVSLSKTGCVLVAYSLRPDAQTRNAQESLRKPHSSRSDACYTKHPHPTVPEGGSVSRISRRSKDRRRYFGRAFVGMRAHRRVAALKQLPKRRWSWSVGECRIPSPPIRVSYGDDVTSPISPVGRLLPVRHSLMPTFPSIPSAHSRFRRRASCAYERSFHFSACWDFSLPTVP